MKTILSYIKAIVSKMAAVMIDGDSREWPPSCSFFIYQPMRPQTKKNLSLPEEQK